MCKKCDMPHHQLPHYDKKVSASRSENALQSTPGTLTTKTNVGCSHASVASDVVAFMTKGIDVGAEANGKRAKAMVFLVGVKRVLKFLVRVLYFPSEYPSEYEYLFPNHCHTHTHTTSLFPGFHKLTYCHGLLLPRLIVL